MPSNDDEQPEKPFDEMSDEELSDWYLEMTSRYPEVPPGDEFLQENGKLRPNLQPAAYLDTSVAIDYWWTAGAHTSDLFADLRDTKRLITEFLWQQWFSKRDTRFDTMVEVRDMIFSGDTGVTLVTTPLALIELQSYIAEVNMLYWLHETAGAKELMRRGRKDLGDILRVCWDARQPEDREMRDALHWMEAGGVLAPSYADRHGLGGVVIASIRGLDLSVVEFWESAVWLMAYVQIGAADVLHTCIAKHLGCQYFVSFDHDFKRVADEMESEMGMELIRSHQQLLDTMRRHPRREDEMGG